MPYIWYEYVNIKGLRVQLLKNSLHFMHLVTSLLTHLPTDWSLFTTRKVCNVSFIL